MEMTVDLKELLKTHGLKATAQRLSILDYLIHCHTHPTAEEIHGAFPEISLATVYNTLEKLIASKLVIVMGDGLTRRYDYYGEPHYHIINKTTGEILDADNFDLHPLLDAARSASGLTITGFNIEVYGENQKKEE